MSEGDGRPTVILSANSCWNLLNFRDALIAGLQEAGYRVVVFVPVDGHAEKLRSRGVEVHDFPMARSGINPAADGRLLLRYLSAFRRIRPAAYCGFTIKPNVYGAAAAGMVGVPAINNVTGLGTTFLSHRLQWRIARRLYRWAFRRSHRLFFHNCDDMGIFVSQGIIRPEQGAVIPWSGIDLDEFQPARWGGLPHTRRCCSSAERSATRAYANMSKPRGSFGRGCPNFDFRSCAILIRAI